MKKILIGVQARSGSSRLPRKALELIGGKMMTDWVIDACKKAASYTHQRESMMIHVALLTPEDDPIAKIFGSRCDIVEGPEQDVLTRYAIAHSKFDCDYVVRITGDCPMIPPYVISRLITLGVRHEYDYISNVDERFRTSLDGIDCEVMSARLLEHLHRNADRADDREHVTLMARREPPDWAKMGAVVSHFDHSDLKLSVDTAEDLARVRASHEQSYGKFKAAVSLYGHTAVHIL